jgi:hypothetical protein
VNKTRIILSILAALSGGGAMLVYVQNGALAGKIRDIDAQCERQIALLKEKYQAEIDDLRRYLLEQYNQSPEPAVAEPAKPTFNQLVSSGHRMQAIRGKYEFLLESALLDAEGKKQLRALLYRWERLADSVRARRQETGSAPAELQGELDATEARIQALLTDPLDYEHFLRLRQQEL